MSDERLGGYCIWGIWTWGTSGGYWAGFEKMEGYWKSVRGGIQTGVLGKFGARGIQIGVLGRI